MYGSICMICMEFWSNPHLSLGLRCIPIASVWVLLEIAFKTQRGSWHGERYISRRNVQTQTKLAIVCIHMPLFSAIFSHHENLPNISNTLDNGVSFGCIAESWISLRLWSPVKRVKPGVPTSAISVWLARKWPSWGVRQSTSIQLENIKEHTGYFNLFWFPNIAAFKKFEL